MKSKRQIQRKTLRGRSPITWTALAVSVLVFVALGYYITRTKAAGTPLTTAQCLARPTTQITKFPATKTGRYDVDGIFDRTFDARGSVQRDTPTPNAYANTINIHPDSGSGARNCWIGGAIFGNIPWNIGWQDWYPAYDGDGLDIGTKSDWDVVDGLRVDNVSDALEPQGLPPAELVARNLYFTNVRDDCIEMDQYPKTLTVSDSYLECYTGLSEEPDDGGAWQQPGGTTTTLDHVLMWQKPMVSTGCRNTSACADGTGANQLFKMYNNQQTPVITVKDSVFRVDEPSEWGVGEMAWPSQVQFVNTKLVWLGGGSYPAGTKPGLTITTDVNVWNTARADWLARHGCPAGGDTTGLSCTALINPTPPGGGITPTPTPTPTPAALPEDLNGDGHVTILDLSALLSHWGQTGTGVIGDINADGTVGIFDLSRLLSKWGV